MLHLLGNKNTFLLSDFFSPLYTSSIAETIVESQINTRFKRKQKMQWTRENAHNVLQIKATMHSNEWNLYEANIDNQLSLKAA